FDGQDLAAVGHDRQGAYREMNRLALRAYATTDRRRRSLFSSRCPVHSYSRLKDETAWPSGSGDRWQPRRSGGADGADGVRLLSRRQSLVLRQAHVLEKWEPVFRIEHARAQENLERVTRSGCVLGARITAMEIEGTTFGTITSDGKTYEHDVIIRR